MASIKSKYTVDPPATNLLSNLFDAAYNEHGGWPDSEPLLLSAKHPDFPGYTIDEIKPIVRALGCGLNNLGTHGKRIMVYGTDNVHFSLAILGVLAAGAACNILPTSPVEYLVNRLRQLNCDTILFAPQDLETVRAAAKELGIPDERLFVVDEVLQNPEQTCCAGAVRHWSYLLDTPGRETYEWPRLSSEEAKNTTAFLIYTSGTTGISKLAERTHYSLIGSIQSALYHYNLEKTHRETMACCYKFSGLGFLMLGILIPLKARYKTIFPAPFDPFSFSDTMKRSKPTILAAPKHILRAILAMPQRPDLSSVRHVPTGGAVISYELIAEWQETFGSQIQSLYGMTEAGFLATPEPTHLVRDASVGTLLPSVEAKILDDTGSLLQRNARGDVYIRTPFVMKGYLHEPIETVETVSEDGWLRTGDIGWVDEEDKLYIVGRSKDLFKIRGDSVTAAEIEAAVLLHPGVQDVAVIPIVLPGDPEPVPRGYIVKAEKSTLTLDALASWVRQNYPPEFSLLGGASFIEEVPIVNVC
ncbi:AMP-binding enzyme [Aspergillus carlsbadensis]|nr:AMP-binding enzyme [Aspergillus carlsbadensis]